LLCFPFRRIESCRVSEIKLYDPRSLDPLKLSDGLGVSKRKVLESLGIGKLELLDGCCVGKVELSKRRSLLGVDVIARQR
jgi:hypothetical protein